MWIKHCFLWSFLGPKYWKQRIGAQHGSIPDFLCEILIDTQLLLIYLFSLNFFFFLPTPVKIKSKWKTTLILLLLCPNGSHWWTSDMRHDMSEMWNVECVLCTMYMGTGHTIDVKMKLNEIGDVQTMQWKNIQLRWGKWISHQVHTMCFRQCHNYVSTIICNFFPLILAIFISWDVFFCPIVPTVSEPFLFRQFPCSNAHA